MKRAKWLILCLVAALALTAVGCVPSAGQQIISIPAQQSTGIWVTGQGETTATPDVAILTLGIETRALTVAEAQSQAAVTMDGVTKALRDSGIADRDIRTQQYS